MEIKIRINDRLVRGGDGGCGRLIVPMLAAVILAGVTVALPADPTVIPNVFKTGEVISSSQMNANFATVRDELNVHDGVIATLLSPTGAVWGLNDPDIFYNDGSVGIGRNDPAFLLHLYSNSGDVGLTVESANVSYPPYIALGMSTNYDVKIWRHTTNHSLNFDTGGSTRMTLDTAGTLSVARIEDTAGSSYYVDPASTSHLGSLETRGWITSGESGSAGRIRVLDSGETERFWADGASGNMGLSGIALIMGGAVIGDPAANANLNVWGIATAYSHLLWSDARLKKNIAPLQGSLDKLTRLQGVSYEWNNDEAARPGSPGRQIGLVAQDVEAVFPELVTETDQGYLALSYDGLTALLLEAVKELKAENDLLKERVANLEAR